MSNKVNLYLLSTVGLGDFYLISPDPTSAERLLESLLNKADYGLSDKRKVIRISILTSELGEFPSGKPNFSSGNKLIISK